MLIHRFILNLKPNSVSRASPSLGNFPAWPMSIVK